MPECRQIAVGPSEKESTTGSAAMTKSAAGAGDRSAATRFLKAMRIVARNNASSTSAVSFQAPGAVRIGSKPKPPRSDPAIDPAVLKPGGPYHRANRSSCGLRRK